VKTEYIVEGNLRRVALEKTSSGLRFTIDGNPCSIRYEELTSGYFVVEKDGTKYRILVREIGERTYVWVNGQTLILERPKSEAVGIVGSSDSHLTAPMPGTLRKLLVTEGQAVEPKQTVAILEAMKMEHNLRAPRAGKVAKIFFKEGDVLEADATVLDLEPLEEEG
jgi:biotin carboxyl carrier protein